LKDASYPISSQEWQAESLLTPAIPSPTTLAALTVNRSQLSTETQRPATLLPATPANSTPALNITQITAEIKRIPLSALRLAAELLARLSHDRFLSTFNAFPPKLRRAEHIAQETATPRSTLTNYASTPSQKRLCHWPCAFRCFSQSIASNVESTPASLSCLTTRITSRFDITLGFSKLSAKQTTLPNPNLGELGQPLCKALLERFILCLSLLIRRRGLGGGLFKLAPLLGKCRQ
jgi:hypothetical protein